MQIVIHKLMFRAEVCRVVQFSRRRDAADEKHVREIDLKASYKLQLLCWTRNSTCFCAVICNAWVVSDMSACALVSLNTDRLTSSTNLFNLHSSRFKGANKRKVDWIDLRLKRCIYTSNKNNALSTPVISTILL